MLPLWRKKIKIQIKRKNSKLKTAVPHVRQCGLNSALPFAILNEIRFTSVKIEEESNIFSVHFEEFPLAIQFIFEA